MKSQKSGDCPTRRELIPSDAACPPQLSPGFYLRPRRHPPLLLGEQLPPFPSPLPCCGADTWLSSFRGIRPSPGGCRNMVFHKQGFLPRKASNQCHSTPGCAGSGSWL